jgi:hypothetical protein
MALGTKNRQKQTADLCKQHLREKYPDKLGLVEEFIVQIEGCSQHPDVTQWGQFTHIKEIKSTRQSKYMLLRPRLWRKRFKPATPA